MLLNYLTRSKIERQAVFSSHPWVNSMVRSNYPTFRLLLYLEWLLLAAAMTIELLIPFQSYWSLLLRAVTIVVFGLMGFLLPRVKLGTKLIYTALEFGLILLSAIQATSTAPAIFLSLSLVLVIRSCLMFKISKQLIVLGLCLISYGILLFTRPISHGNFKVIELDWRPSNMLLFSLTLLFAILLINALIAESQSREKLEIAHQELERTNQQLRQYALRIEDQATLQERNRIAREIHDGLGHTLAAQTIQINNALLFWQSNNDEALMFVKQAKQLGADALLEIRRSLSVLRSNPLQGQSLKSALEKLLTDFKKTGIEPSYIIDIPPYLPTEINTAIYRIVQESLTNIYKHALATNVNVELRSSNGIIHLSIKDNGKGFNPTQNTTGFGLQGMRERATALGGELNIHSQLETGCCISVSLPLSKLY